MLWILIVLSFILLQSGSCEESKLAFTARDGKGWGSETSTTFFDIALTALAFLSFGIFLLNLLLNALLFPSVTGTTPLTTPTAPILTMITGNTGGAIVTGRSSFKSRHRSKRSVFSPEIDHAAAMQYFVRYVTSSIEAMAQKHECLPKLFCDGNRKSRIMGKGFQVMFPAVSISISYIGQVLGLHDDFQRHINAIVLGASEANCQRSYPKCKGNLNMHT